jgi:hypothetical protein
MADFVAVIRRTVDGLSDNSPEMRSRVYEKARGAVRRQLEGMKPRPSDEMIDRQMGKLEAAISEVEASNAAAAFVPEPTPLAPEPVVPAAVAEPIVQDTREPEPAAQPVEAFEPPSYVDAQPAQEERPWADAAPQAPDADGRLLEPEAEPAVAHFVQPAVPYDVSHVEAGPADVEPHAIAPEPDAPSDAEMPPAVEAYEPEPQEPETYEAQTYEAAEYEPQPALPEPAEPDASAGFIEPSSDERATEAPEPLREEPAVLPSPAFDLAPSLEPGAPDDVVYAEAQYADIPADDGHLEPVAPTSAVASWDETYAADRSEGEDAATEARIEPYDDAAYDDNDQVAEENPDAAFSPADPAIHVPEPVTTPVADTAYGHAELAPIDDDADLAAHRDTFFRDAVPDLSMPVADGYVDRETRLAPDAAAEPAAPALPSADWDLPEWSDPLPTPEPVQAVPVATVPVTGSATGHVEPIWAEHVDPVRVDAAPGHGIAEPVNVPPVSGGVTADGEPSHSWALDETDPFQQEVRPESVEPVVSDWSWPVDRTGDIDRTASGQRDEAGEERPVTPASWDEIDSLLTAGGASAAAQSRPQSLAPDPAPPPPRPASYRAEPRKSAFSIKRVVTVLVLLLVVGGAGYTYWANRETMNGWVSDMIASINTPPPQTANGAAPASGTGNAASGTAASGSATTDVASLQPSNKFTQRLQTDGTEVDEGAALPPAGTATAQEGKSVAPQTEASRPVDTADAAGTAIAPTVAPDAPAAPADPAASSAPQSGTSPSTTPAATPAVDPTPAPDQATTQMPAGAQKMFLYEERLGQTAPTAIEGGVAWSLKEETPVPGQRPEPVIQAQITVPDRGLTALMTIKRNTDTSLPASHTIEFVFSLPENFEGGSIDSVQRVAMKRTEQDRGDPLIAVPAKITDDFHMIALNDFPEAVTTNLDLMRTRSWIDIPLTYRNGRRALLTLEKGAAGTEAFTKALADWSQARPAGQ